MTGVGQAEGANHDGLSLDCPLNLGYGWHVASSHGGIGTKRCADRIAATPQNRRQLIVRGIRTARATVCWILPEKRNVACSSIQLITM
jgi:hypothetical protein